ncbi:MAG: cyanophycin synthetase [Candidatus Eisenbacteria bacterium]|nr:cyanophycin synthetase [Candidatus Eisenbacteria bacterium]
MKVLETSVYLGPNLYALFPVIRMTVDLEALEEWPTGRLGKGFTQGLLHALPGLHEHGCSYGEPGGFIRRLSEDQGTWLGHVLEHVAIELQNSAGVRVTFGKTRGAGEKGQYHVVYQYEQADVGIEAGKVALGLLNHLLPADLRAADFEDEGYNFSAERDAYIRFAQRRALGPSTAALVRAGEERDIPWIRLNDYSLIQFGHGKLQKRIQATVTSETRHIAVEIASDKEETNRILNDLGLPVPKQRLVYSEDEAVREARRVGYPVVVKPLNANHGRGVSLNLTESEQVKVAFEQARQHSRGVIIESYVTGWDHRMLVVNGELIAVAKRVPGHVVGDGVHTIDQLVEITNQDPRRGIGHEKVLTRIEFDHQSERVLANLGYTRESVPPKDEIVYLRSTGNISTGGTAVDVTDLVHPDNREMAVRAVAAIGLDVAGVDFLSQDISVSYKEGGGAICEINAAPGFRMHVAPSEGQPRDVAGPVMDMLFPPGTPSRIPIAAITGTNGKTTTARMLAHIFKLTGHTVGLCTTDGVYINGQLTVKGDMTGPIAARMVLRDPQVDVAVLETARGGLLRSGMGYRYSSVSACLNVAADHLGMKGIDTLEQLAEVKRIPIEVARDTVVLNADDPLCLKMADYAQSKHVCYATMSSSHPLVREHIRAGGRAIVLEEGINGHMITLYDKGAHIPLLWTHLIPATLEGKALFNVQNAMFAAAMAYAMGQKLEDIRHGLRTFDTTFFQAPGRMNVYDEHPFKVILDYGHNPAAVHAVVQLVERLEVKGRRILVLAAPGDRRDEDIREIARFAAGKFDHYICRRDDSLRGRSDEEVPRMLRATLLEAGVPDAQIEVIADEQRAIDHALQLARLNDLLLVFADAISRSWKQILHFRPEGASAPTNEAGSPVRFELPNQPTPLGPGETLVRDGRGVRVARESED